MDVDVAVAGSHAVTFHRPSVGIAILVALIVLLVAPVIVRAGNQGTCPSSDTSKALLRENIVGDLSDGNDGLWVCGNVGNLGHVPHTMRGGCNGPLLGWGLTWNDCISSADAWVPATQALCLYPDQDYWHPSFHPPVRVEGPKTGYRFNLPGRRYLATGYITDRDTVSSLRWVPKASGC